MDEQADPPSAVRLQAQALRAGQRYLEADVLLTSAAQQFPRDFPLHFMHAQTRYELGYPAAHLYAAAKALDLDNRDVVRNQALALISEGRPDQAEALLRGMLGRQPGWLDGLKVLATLKWGQGDPVHFADHYADACRAMPNNPALWIAWFRMVAQARDWAGAGAILDEAERHLGTIPAIEACRLFVAVESHDDAAAASLLTRTAHFRGDVTSLCRIRHFLRTGDPKAAEAEALPLIATPSAALYWPYLSLAWRMLGDARWEWLDQPDSLIAARDIGCSGSELEQLADVLRALHTASTPYIEQSVRGGTQTDRSVLLRREPELQKLKARMLEVVRDYIDQLPPHDSRHPLLSAPRGGPLLLEGSWSVRLLQQGYNVPHTHAMGWLSTAFYVSLPEASAMGPEPAGYIAFGAPPAELGIGLAPYRTIRPEPGRLAMFPSTTWHSTMPFEDGERLVVAFDIRRPRG